MRGRSRSTLLAVTVLLVAGCGGGSSAGDPAAPPTSASPTTARGVTVFDVGAAPCGIAVAAGSVWVSDAAEATLYRIDPSTGAATKAAELDPSPCEITVAFGSLWVVTQSGFVDRIDPRSGRRTARVPVGTTSYQVMQTPGALWVSNRGDGTLTRVDPRTAKAVDTVRLRGVKPGGMAYAGGSLWIGDDTSGNSYLLRMDPETGDVSRVRSGGSRPAYLAEVDGDVWVSNSDDGTVSHLDATTGKVVATVDVGLNPVNLKPGPDGAVEVWVPDDLDGTVTRIDATTGTVVETFQVDGGPAVVRAVGDDVWVTLFTSGQVARLTPTG
jgi:YVTN family beta-propeller protein